MIEVRKVLTAVAKASEDARRRIVSRFRSAGGSVDRWKRWDRWTMADSITRVEDELELEARGHMTAARLGLRTIRRSIEDDLNDSESSGAQTWAIRPADIQRQPRVEASV